MTATPVQPYWWDSARNGGITGGNIRPTLTSLARRFGQARADAIFAEAKVARADLYRFIADKGIECDFKQVGRLSGAATPEAYESGTREAARLHGTLGIEAYVVSRGEQRGWLGLKAS